MVQTLRRIQKYPKRVTQDETTSGHHQETESLLTTQLKRSPRTLSSMGLLDQDLSLRACASTQSRVHGIACRRGSGIKSPVSSQTP